jgi:predicted ATPase
MRLSAIYIREGVLSHIFGVGHIGQTINLGGKYNYTFEEVEEDVYVQSRKTNHQFIDGFWEDNVCLISAIVGENGIGKTSILYLLGQPYSHCSFVYESLETDEYFLYDNAESSEIVYYSPHFTISQSSSENDFFRDLSKVPMMIDDTEYENFDLSTLLQLHDSENIKRWIKFIEIKDIANLLKDISLPVFDKINIKINYFPIDEHQTPYSFRPFFKKLAEIIDEENTKRQQAEIERLQLKRKDLMNSRATNKIRLELEVLKRVISKTQNILESSGNKYLQEGFLKNKYTIDSPEFKKQATSKDAFYWFLENAFIQLSPKSKKILFPKKEIKNLIETITFHLPESEDIENWTELNVDLKGALRILKAYEKYLVAFKNDFAFDKKILLKFKPFVNLSSGEKGLYDIFSVLYDLNHRIENGLHTDYTIFNKRKKSSNNFLILLDEGDLGFHPEWKKKYITIIQQVIPYIFKNKNIQVIITTHDPLTLSDFPRNNIIYLKKDGSRTYIYDNHDIKSFGANISDLLKDSFFVKDGLIGDFAKGKIDGVIKKLNGWMELRASNKPINISPTKIENIKKVISLIDEPIIQQKLIEMHNTIFDNSSSIDKEIYSLEQRLEFLKNLKK